MSKSIKLNLAVLVFISILTSCKNGETLQSYYVAKQEVPNFMSIDIPLSFVEIDKANLTADQKEAYESIDKLNMLGYKLTEGKEEEYKTELDKVINILKHDKYHELIRAGNKSDGKIVVKYIGTETTIDELVVLGDMKNRGFAIVRVLGDDMNPTNIMKLGEVVKGLNSNEDQLKEFITFFK